MLKMNMKIEKKIILIFKLQLIVFFLLITGSFCGLPSNETLEKLNFPAYLRVDYEKYESIEKIPGIHIKFMCNNSEPAFTGYNIYMNRDSESSLNTILNERFRDNNKNKHIEFILKKENKPGNTSIPTIPKNVVVQIYNSVYPASKISNTEDIDAPWELEFLIMYDTEGISLRRDTYYLGVTAYNDQDGVESKMSNVISVVFPDDIIKEIQGEEEENSESS